MSTTDPPSDPVAASLDLRRGPAAAALLQQVIERCRSEAAVVVFDLDSTLLDNKPRQARIMAEYGREHGVTALATTRAEHWTGGWDYRAAMRNAGLPADQVEAHAEPYRDLWRERFFTSEYCRIDDAVAGAVRYVQAIHATGCRLLYVTGRQESMRRGSEECFARLGFPLPKGDRVQLWMKPSLDEADDDFKARVHADLHDAGTLQGVFDNEPAHVNDYHRSFPEALVVHLATDHSMRPIPVVDGIPSVPDFSDWPGSG